LSSLQTLQIPQQASQRLSTKELMLSARFRFCLLPDGAVLVVSAALKEAVTHHALAKQEKDHQQNE
jgi:hypothetical protein